MYLLFPTQTNIANMAGFRIVYIAEKNDNVLIKIIVSIMVLNDTTLL